MYFFRKLTCTLTGGLMTALAVSASVYYSTARVNHEKYQVMGVDVSNYQGDIDWQALEAQDISFAFIKATEGSGHVDESVRRNLDRAADTGIMVSAYHFFSFDSSGHTQAENFISAVPKEDIDMPPVVDLEYYGDKSTNKPSREETEAILRPLLEELEEFYGVTPIIYTTIPVYLRYVKSDFSEYPLWIRSVSFEPDLMDWKFWQYCDCGELEGYIGDEKYIDLDVYNGTQDEFLREFGDKKERR